MNTATLPDVIWSTPTDWGNDTWYVTTERLNADCAELNADLDGSYSTDHAHCYELQPDGSYIWSGAYPGYSSISHHRILIAPGDDRAGANQSDGLFHIVSEQFQTLRPGHKPSWD